MAALGSSSAFQPAAVPALSPRVRTAAACSATVGKRRGAAVRSLGMQEKEGPGIGNAPFSRKQQRQSNLPTGMSFQSSELFASPLSPGGTASKPVGGSVNKKEGNKGAVMAAAVALGSGMLAWAIEQGGTFCIVEVLFKMTGTDSIRALIEFMTAWASTAHWQGYIITTGVATVLQLLPLCNGILLMMMLGSMFGTVKGIAVASVAATSSALICMLMARNLLRATFAGKEPPLMQAVGSSIASSDTKSLFIVSLFRLSPVVPFCWSNYLFGLTEVRVLPYVFGTWIGTLPAITAFVSAGVLSKNIAAGTATAPPELIALGLGATLAVLITLGKISQQELNKMAEGGDSTTHTPTPAPTSAKKSWL